jgi:hypothetical protein
MDIIRSTGPLMFTKVITSYIASQLKAKGSDGTILSHSSSDDDHDLVSLK